MDSVTPYQTLPLALSIAGIEIRCDAQGRFCLNDLHRAAGGEKRHQPANWLSLKQTVELIEEIATPGITGVEQNQPLNVINGGDERGTYTAKELVYAYAMWISAAFHLKVIRAYDAMMTRPVAGPAIPQTLPEALRFAADLAEQKAIVEEQLALATPKAEALDRIADADGTMNPTVAAKTLQVPPKQLFNYLREKRWIYRRPGGKGYVAYQDKIQVGYLTHKVTTVQREDGTEKVVEQVLVTGKGLAKLSQAFGMQ